MCPAKGQDRTETAPQGGKSQNSVQSAQPTSEQPHSMQQLAAHYLQRIRLKAWYVYRAYEPRPALLGLPASHACRTASSAHGQTAMPARPQQCTQAPPCTATCVLHQPGGTTHKGTTTQHCPLLRAVSMTRLPSATSTAMQAQHMVQPWESHATPTHPLRYWSLVTVTCSPVTQPT